ncbi:MAG: hypothetical protein IJP92_03260 [Lachnospiraceae bacterium]|nr:hypothetical protein [Lachnospiraceae bacterium]
MWYVIKTAAGREEAACHKCKNAFPESAYRELFVPSYEKPFYRDGSWIVSRVALFPGYLFADTDEAHSEGIRRILESQMSSTAQPVCAGEDFVPVYEDEQAFLAGLMDERHVISISRGDMIGNRLVVHEGPLKHHTGKISWINRHKRMAGLKAYLLREERNIKVGLEIIHKTGAKAG